MRGSRRTLSKPQSLCADCTSCSECRHYLCLYAIDTNYREYVSFYEWMALDLHGYDSPQEAESILHYMREVDPVVIDEGDGVETTMWDTDLYYQRRVAR